MFQIDLTSIQSLSSWLWVAIAAVAAVFFRLYTMVRRVSVEDAKRQQEQAGQDRVMQLVLDTLKSNQEDQRQNQRAMENRLNKLSEQNTVLQREISKLHGDTRACAAENAVLREEVGAWRARAGMMRNMSAEALPAPVGEGS